MPKGKAPFRGSVSRAYAAREGARKALGEREKYDTLEEWWAAYKRAQGRARKRERRVMSTAKRERK